MQKRLEVSQALGRGHTLEPIHGAATGIEGAVVAGRSHPLDRPVDDSQQDDESGPSLNLDGTAGWRDLRRGAGPVRDPAFEEVAAHVVRVVHVGGTAAAL